MSAMLDRIGRLFSTMPQSIVGVDIGAEAIKIVEVAWNKGRPVLKNIGVITLPDSTVDNGYFTDSKIIGERIRQLIAVNGITSKDAILAVGGQTIFVREVSFPVMNTTELREAIKWDIEKYVPFASESYYFDFSIVGPGKTDMEMRVLLVAAPKEMINSVIAATKEAGLRPIAIDIEPLALYRAVNVENSLVIDIGAQITQMVVFQGGSPVVTRTIPLGGRRFTTTIMQVLELDAEEAELLKQRQKNLLQAPGVVGQPTMVHQQLEILVAELVREIARTMEYYRMQNKDALIEKVVVTGGGAKLDNLMAHLVAGLNMPVIAP